jgi:hypothetical protein
MSGLAIVSTVLNNIIDNQLGMLADQLVACGLDIV